jgi:hypothetical protein
MMSNSYLLKLPASIKKAAQRLAKEDGVSLNQWISVAVAQKIGAVEMAEEFFKKRAAGTKAGGMNAVLKRVKKVTALPGDELNS